MTKPRPELQLAFDARLSSLRGYCAVEGIKLTHAEVVAGERYLRTRSIRSGIPLRVVRHEQWNDVDFWPMDLLESWEGTCYP